MIRPEMQDHLYRLGAWSCVGLVLPLALIKSKIDSQRGFAVLSMGWSVINLLIMGAGLMDRSEPKLPQTREFLALNLGLNCAYMAVGITLMILSRRGDFRKGAGFAVLLHGFALLVLDGYLLSRLPQVATGTL